MNNLESYRIKQHNSKASFGQLKKVYPTEELQTSRRARRASPTRRARRARSNPATEPSRHAYITDQPRRNMLSYGDSEQLRAYRELQRKYIHSYRKKGANAVRTDKG